MTSTVLAAPATVVPPRRVGIARRFIANPQAAFATTLLLLIVGSAVFAPLVTAYPPDAIDAVNRFAGPSARHWFGTDELGRDLFSRVVYGGRIALGIAAAATLIATVLGVVWGFVAARAGGWVEEGMLRLVDVVMAIPIVMFALILVAAFGSSPVTLSVIAGLLLAPGTARIARSAVLTELESDYSLAATSVGVPRLRLLFGEILPNTAPTLIARASLVAADAIMIEASLSFLGLGVSPPDASWGTLLREGYSHIFNSLSYVAFPGLMIFVAIWVFNTLGDRLQTTLDPRVPR
ncbi:MAG: ABC transporter permease [Nocardioidaceae bacterium]